MHVDLCTWSTHTAGPTSWLHPQDDGPAPWVQIEAGLLISAHGHGGAAAVRTSDVCVCVRENPSGPEPRRTSGPDPGELLVLGGGGGGVFCSGNDEDVVTLR